MCGKKQEPFNFITVSEKVRGFSHIKNKTKCQDRFKVEDLHYGKIIAVADGHGSSKCKYSHEGAKIATEVFCYIISKICKSYDEDINGLRLFLSSNRLEILPKKIVQEWRRRVEVNHYKKNRTEKFQYELYGTTLLGLLIVKDFYFAMQLGDGDILYVDRNESVNYLIEADRLLGTETYSISSKNAWKYMRSEIHYIDDFKKYPLLFMVSTDGYSNSYLSNDDFLKCGSDYYEMILNYGPEKIKNNLKEWLNEISHEGCGDDIALVIAYNQSNSIK